VPHTTTSPWIGHEGIQQPWCCDHRIRHLAEPGLGAGVWTSDIGRAFRMSERIRSGTVWVNTYRAVSYLAPFGGFKD